MTYSVVTPNGNVPTFRTLVQPDKLATYFGGCWKGGPTPTNLPVYLATVQKDGVDVTTYTVPLHEWHARWIHDLTPDTILYSPADLVAQKLMFPFGTPGKNQPAKPTNKFTGMMSTAGIRTAMGTTGQADDIGLIPEWEAFFARTGDAGPMLEAAKGFDSMPIYRIDPNTNRFVDMLAHPYACADGRYSNIADFIPTPDGAVVPKSQWSMDISHHPAVYLAYCATRKLRYLESLQALAVFCLQMNNWYSTTYNKNVPIIHSGQMRGFAWTLRTLLMAWRATQIAEASLAPGATLPEPLLPSSNFKGILDANLNYFTVGFMQDPAIQGFRYFPDVTCYRPWQFMYDMDALGFSVLAGAGQGWTDLYMWALYNPIQRLNGKSGWPPALQVEYMCRLGPKGAMPDGANGFPKEIPASSFFHGPQPWKEAWDNFVVEANAAFASGQTSYNNMTKAQIDALVADPTGGGDYINWDNYTPQTVRHIMAEADYLDKLGLAPISQTYPDFPVCRDRISSMVLKWEAKSPNNKISSRVSAVSIAAPTQPPEPPMPPEVPPPVTDPLAPINAAADKLIALAPQVQAAVDSLEAARDALKAAGSTGSGIDPVAIAAVAAKLEGVRVALKAAVDDAAS